MPYKHSDFCVDIPNHDCDVTIKLNSGKEILVQIRPSNADGDYNGSLDVILSENLVVLCYEGDNMENSKAPFSDRQHERFAKQMVIERV